MKYTIGGYEFGAQEKKKFVCLSVAAQLTVRVCIAVQNGTTNTSSVNLNTVLSFSNTIHKILQGKTFWKSLIVLHALSYELVVSLWQVVLCVGVSKLIASVMVEFWLSIWPLVRFDSSDFAFPSMNDYHITLISSQSHAEWPKSSWVR